jgi:hypothetical protein
MLRSCLEFLMILLAPSTHAGSRFGGGGLHAGGGGFHGGGLLHRGVSAFHRIGGRARGFFGGYSYGYNCGIGFDCGVSDYGYGYGGGAGNAVSSGSGPSGSYIPWRLFRAGPSRPLPPLG